MLKKILEELLPCSARLVAVSKTKTPKEILTIYKQGQRIFGENRVQELIEKQEVLPPDIEWHLIGHLQTNKVKYIAPFVHLIHSVDSLKLLAEINRQALKNARIIDCLLQVKIAREETKFGLEPDKVRTLLTHPEFKEMKNIRICGLMGMASFSTDPEVVRSEFKSLKKLFDELKSIHFVSNPEFGELSMGMSGDYQIALQEGSTLVRIGSLLFGARL